MADRWVKIRLSSYRKDSFEKVFLFLFTNQLYKNLFLTLVSAPTSERTVLVPIKFIFLVFCSFCLCLCLFKSVSVEIMILSTLACFHHSINQKTK